MRGSLSRREREAGCRPAARVTSLGEALDALEKQPGASWMLGTTALGLMAFAFVEARWRKIGVPRGGRGGWRIKKRIQCEAS